MRFGNRTIRVMRAPTRIAVYSWLTGSAPNGAFALGRPWHPYAKVVYLECEMDKIISPAGWNNWGNAENEKTAYYAEYKSRGA